jgi:hypothetical protein
MEHVDGNQRYGLRFNGKQVLEPTYRTMQIRNRDVERKTPEWADWSYENNCPIVIADGKQGLLHEGRLLTDIIYDRIIKLTYCHYLCQHATQYHLYYANYIGYWSISHGINFELLATMSIHKELTVEVLNHALSETHPAVYKGFIELFAPTPRRWWGRYGYVAEYRYYGAVATGCDFCDRVERVVMDSHFYII